MGYVPKRATYVLEFDTDDELAGLEVKARGVDLGTFLDLTAMADLSTQVAEGKNVGQGESMRAIRAVGDLLTGFAAVLVSWNVETEAGVPVPADIDGLRSQAFPFVFKIIRAWMSAAAGVSDPLVEPSSSGAPSPVGSLPMEPLSPSLAS